MITIKIKTTSDVMVKYLLAECGVRYWEDGKVNGVEDEAGDLIPLRDGDTWRLMIDLDTGIIEGWPIGTVAYVHYKVCDDGRYALLDENRKQVKMIDGYVPEIMSPAESGHGDYVIMHIGEDGKIANWKVDLREFEKDGGCDD